MEINKLEQQMIDKKVEIKNVTIQQITALEVKIANSINVAIDEKDIYKKLSA